MKCPVCDGKGYTYVRTAPNPITGYGYKRICDKCHGTGEIKQTEQEYIQTCNTEQLAEWLVEHMDCVSCHCKKDLCCQDYNSCKLTFVEWLKQPHTNEETK